MRGHFSFSPRRKAGVLLLAWALTAGWTAVRAGMPDSSAFHPGTLSLASPGQPPDDLPGPLNIPGTPYLFTNPGGATILIEALATSAQPAPVAGNDKAFDITNVFAGDVVFLLDPAGGNDPSNWTAVLRFLNLNDPTGTNGLPADELEGFDATNVGPGGFANFQLFPNTIYLADTPLAPGYHEATTGEFGPDGGIPAGQVAIFLYMVDVTDSGGTGPGSGNVPEPATCLLLGLGGSVLIANRLHRRRLARA